jgi:hypothetical protein
MSASLPLVLVVLILPATPALARQTRVLTSSFGSETAIVKDPYPLRGGGGIAVDESSGAIYVTDPSNFRVEKFDAEGRFVLMFGRAVNKTKVEGLATEEEQDVCTELEVELGAECQNGTPGTTPGAFGEGGMTVAVDNTTGLSHGDVYVGNHKRVAKFDEGGELVATWGKAGQLDGTSITKPLPGPFESVNGVAVDGSGNLWVYGSPREGAEDFERARVFEFAQDSTFVTDWSPPEGEGEHPTPNLGIAVDGEDNVYLNNSFGSGNFTFKYTSKGALTGQVTERAVQPGALAIGGSELYVGVQEAAGFRIQNYERSCQSRPAGEGCAATGSFSAASLHPSSGLAVSSASPGDTIYAAAVNGGVAGFSAATVPDVDTALASGFTAGTAILNGAVDPSGLPLTECFFEWGETEEYGHTAPCEEPGVAEIGKGTGAVEVHAKIDRATGTTYHYRLVAVNAEDVNEPGASEGGDVLFGPPLIDGESSSQVTATSATLQAEVDPQNVATSYHAEYLTEAEFQADGGSFSGPDTPTSLPEPDGDAGAGVEVQRVPVELRGLAAATTYHYRFIVQSALAEGAEAVVGEGRSFTTQGEHSEFTLPDARRWEMVSPPNKLGASIAPLGEDGLVQAAAGAGAISYLASTPTESEVEGYSNSVQVLATRTATGWRSTDIATPQGGATGANTGAHGEEYRLFSQDLSAAVVQPFGVFTQSLSDEASEQTPFLHDLATGGYVPLVTGCPGEGRPCPAAVQEHTDVPPGTVFGASEDANEGSHSCPPNLICGPRFRGATPDLGHVVLQAAVPLTKTTPEADSGGLYEYSGGRLALVSVLPEGNPVSEGAVLGGWTETYRTTTARAISSDGSRIVFAVAETANKHLYLRENALQPQSKVVGGQCTEPAEACTVQLDVGLSGEPVFQTASADASEVFFTDGSSSERDLYEYDADRGEVIAVTHGAEVQGSVLGASEDGSYLYFVADAQLAPGAVAGTCGDLSDGRYSSPGSMCNLYVRHNGQTTLVTILAGGDAHDWATDITRMPARVAPDGEWLAFMSQRALTGYDNRDALSGKPDQEVYLYDASTQALTCASCDPSGSRPSGVEVGPGGMVVTMPLAGGLEVAAQGASVAANVPGWLTYEDVDAVYQPRYLSDEGRLFFDSSDALVPLDGNSAEDVYEYEPAGVSPGGHACSASSSSGSEVFRPAHSFVVDGIAGEESPGCVSLISSGESPEESAFLDASETGADVFFLTAAKLAAQDVDTSLDVYDAHECTAASPCVPPAAERPPGCTTEASCKPSPTPQPSIYGLPSSATFSGPGNLAPPPPAAPAKPASKKPVKCKRGFVKNKKRKCVRRKPRPRNAKKARRAVEDRRPT